MISGSRDTWRVRGAFEDVVIELYPGSIDAAAAEASLSVVRGLIGELRSSRPEARRTLLEVYARLRGLPSERPDDPRVAEELLLAARTHRLVARRLERRTVVVPLEEAEEDLLGPASRPDLGPDSKTWVGLVLLDQDGTPVPGRPYRVIQPDGTTVDGVLDSNGAAMLKGLDPGNCQIWCPYVPASAAATYTVRAGDHVSGIAQSFGFDDYAGVWNDPGNTDLQSLRDDPHVLQPGDALVIPEVTARPTANKPTGAKHPFTIQRSPLKLRLTLLDLSAKAISGAQVTVDGAVLTTDGSGLVESPVDKGAPDVTMDASGTALDLALGALNPSDDATDGWKARLYNLGFLWDPTADETDDEMLLALEDFQAQYSLQLSRQLDGATKSRLVQVYGC